MSQKITAPLERTADVPPPTRPGTQEKPAAPVATDEQADFTPPPSLPVSHPWLARYHRSALLAERAIASNDLNTALTSTFGNPSHPIAFAIGNGGAGYTGLFKPLCAKFIWTHGNDFRIGWIANHSRHSQIALLGDVVQVALTYEPDWEVLAEREGWCQRVVAPVLWDHFVLVGPKEDPAGLSGGGAGGEGGVRGALSMIAEAGEGVRFFSRGDGSATFTREQQFWEDLGVDVGTLECVETHALPPYKALVAAEEGGAYMLSDRGIFLTAKRDGVIPNMRVYVEGGKDLLNPCSALVNAKVPDTVAHRLAVRFAQWLGEYTAQGTCRGYGRVWEIGMPLFTAMDREEFGDEELLVGRDL